MSLVLAFKQGESFYLDSFKFTVEEIVSPNRVRVRKHGPFDEIVTLVGTRSLELMPQVFVYIGLKSNAYSVRLSFDAPRSIKINREEIMALGEQI